MSFSPISGVHVSYAWPYHSESLIELIYCDVGIAAALIPYGSVFTNEGGVPPECMVIVDSGYSFTHAIPILNGRVMWNGVRRYGCGWCCQPPTLPSDGLIDA